MIIPLRCLAETSNTSVTRTEDRAGFVNADNYNYFHTNHTGELIFHSFRDLAFEGIGYIPSDLHFAFMVANLFIFIPITRVPGSKCRHISDTSPRAILCQRQIPYTFFPSIYQEQINNFSLSFMQSNFLPL